MSHQAWIVAVLLTVLAHSAAASAELAPPWQLIPDKILGEDERTEIEESAELPYRAIGHFARGCTGTLIGPRHVLTAAHCVYDAENETWHEELEFAPARRGDDVPFGWLDAEAIYAPDAWTATFSTDADIALVVLAERVGEATGWVALGDSGEHGPEWIEIAGYPGDKPRGTLWRDECAIARASPSRYYYDCDTAKGQSGSSLLAPGADGRWATYGVHTNGGKQYNRGTRLTSAILKTVRSWMGAHP